MTDPALLQIVPDIAPAFESGATRCDRLLAEKILLSLSREQLFNLCCSIFQSGQGDLRIALHILMLLDRKPKAPAEVNEPIQDLIAWYLDKESRKVGYARTRLMRRYDGQSIVHQYVILKAFLAGDQEACDWAAQRLWDNWVEPFGTAILERWETTPSYNLAMAVALHLPVTYVLRNEDALCSYVGYETICCRLYGTEGFSFHEERLSVPGLFYVMASLKRRDQIPHLRERLAEYILSLPDDTFPSGKKDKYCLSGEPGFKTILEAMADLGMSEDLMLLYRIQNEASGSQGRGESSLLPVLKRHAATFSDVEQRNN